MMRFTLAAAALLALGGCAIPLKYAPPIRRHVEPMFMGKVAVLSPKLAFKDAREDGSVRIHGTRVIKSYDKVLAEHLAQGLELTGIVESARAVDAKSEDLLSFAKANGKEFDYVLVTELTGFETSIFPSPVVVAVPWSLVGFLGVPIWFGTSYGTVSLNLQLIDVPTGVTLLTANPEVSHKEEWVVGLFDGFIAARHVKSYANAIHQKLIDQIRLDLEREILNLRLNPDARVVPEHMKPGGGRKATEAAAKPG